MAKTEIWDTQNQNTFLFLKKPIYECFFPLPLIVKISVNKVSI